MNLEAAGDDRCTKYIFALHRFESPSITVCRMKAVEPRRKSR
jgi:hypothetical protein